MSHNPKREIFAQLARIGTALSSPVRIEFLELLGQMERNVEQLANLTGISIANTSQHLQKLRQAGLITGRKQGLYVFYRLASDEEQTLQYGMNPFQRFRVPAGNHAYSLFHAFTSAHTPP